MELPASEVLPLVAADPKRTILPGSSMPFCNSGGNAEVDSSCPPEWQVAHAVSRVWAYQLDRGGPELALRYAKPNRGGDGAMMLLDQYFAHADSQPDIASTAAFVLADRNRRPEDRNEAAWILLRVNAPRYYRAVVDYVVTQRDIKPLIDSLVAVSRHPHPQVEPDRRIVRMLFDELETEAVWLAENPGALDTFANALGDVVNERFSPDPTADHNGAPGSRVIARKTVENARSWWRTHASEFPPIR